MPLTNIAGMFSDSWNWKNRWQETIPNQINVFRIGRNTFYNRKNKILMKIPEFKRSGIGLIVEFRGISNGFPNLASCLPPLHSLMADCQVVVCRPPPPNHPILSAAKAVIVLPLVSSCHLLAGSAHHGLGFILCGTIFDGTGPNTIFVSYTSKVP